MKRNITSMLLAAAPKRLDTQIIRISLAILFLAHAYLKPMGHGFVWMEDYFTSVGLPAFLAYVAFASELIAGILFIANRFILPVCVMLAVEMLVIISVHWENGWLFASPGGGWEFPALILMTIIALAVQTYSSSISIAHNTEK